MRLHASEVTAASIPARAVSMHRLARAEAPFATPANEGFIERNQQPLKALKNAVRYVRHERLHVFELRAGRVSRGIATIVEGAVIDHPDLQLTGHDLDYWLRHDAGDEEHRAAAFAVIAQSIKVLRHNGTTESNLPADGLLTRTYFATSFTEAPELNRGFAEVMGEPAARLTLPETPEDTYGIAKGGAELDVFVGRHIL